MSSDIVIEITGLKSLSKFIGLEDTPLYYDNGKFFKVEDNKIIYTDIEWKDISGDIEEAPEIVDLIEDFVETISGETIQGYIEEHNSSESAHPYIQNTIQEEIFTRVEADNTLQDNIDITNNNLEKEIEDRIDSDTLLQNNINNLSNTVTNNYNTLDDKIDTEISNRISSDTTLQDNIDTEASTRQDADATLQDNIDTLSDTISNNYTTLDTKIDDTKTSLEGNISDLSTTVSNNYTTLDGKITNLTSTVNNNYTELNNKILDNTADITTNTSSITNINNKIPEQASASNKLADKNFVNSSIATNTANFIGTFNSVAELEAYSGTLTNNDYAFVATTDSVGNTLYDRYKWNGSEWLFEYELNNSSFTANQWDSINSGITDTLTTQIITNQNAITNIQNNYVPNTRTVNGKALSSNITLNASDVNALANTTTINDLTTTAQQNALNSGATSAKIGQITTNTNNITTNTNDISIINDKIPYDASSNNKLVTISDLSNMDACLANKDLSNLTNLGDGVNRGVKGYNEDGNVIYDKQLVNYVADYAHSTFDLSKFTKVGSPNVTDDGIASGFSTSNYLKITDIYSLFGSKPWKIKFNGTILTGSSPVNLIGKSWANSDAITLGRMNNGDSVFLYIQGTQGTIISSYIFTANATDVLDGYIEFTGTRYNFYCTKNGDTAHPIITGVDSTDTLKLTTTNTTDLYLCYGNSTGSIDLKQFSITVDGVPVFSGNKTGIDTIKSDNYTVIGTPTISADGVASGFSNSNYIKNTNIASVTSNGEFHINFQYSGTQQTTNENIVDFYLTNNQNEVLIRRTANSNSYRCLIFVSGVVIFDKSITNTTDNIRGYVQYKNGVYIFDVNGVIETLASATKIPAGSYTLSLGIRTAEGYVATPITGNIDLNSLKIYVDDSLVYQPCLKIPYAESAYKHGSKIVNMQYLPRVKDAYEQGYPNRYYALQEDYTLNCSVVGTPTIVGTQVSGFSASNYLTKAFSSLSGKAFKIQNRFLYDSTIDGCISHGVGTNNSPRLTASATNQNLEFYFRGTSDVTFTVPYSNFTANTWYNTEAIITPTKQIFQVTDDNGNVVFKETKSTTQTFDIQTQMATYTIGYRSSTDYFSGTVDLAGFKVFVDGNFVGSPVTAPCIALPMGDIYGEIENLKELKINLDRVNQTKALATGNVANCEEEFKEIQERAHSTFDSSKFTKVGSPTISTDGIASGFSLSNWLETPTIDLSKPWKVELTCDTTNGIGAPFSWGANNKNYIVFRGNATFIYISELSLNATSWTVVSLNTKYNIVFGWDGSEYYLNMYNLDGTLYLSKSITSSDACANSKFTIGKSSWDGTPFSGSIDLKQFSITADGVEVFSGNRTGIDTIKPDDYTVVGTPTISNDGVASGFSSSNYITTSKYAPKAPFIDEIEFITGSDVSTTQTIYGQDGNYRFRITGGNFNCSYNLVTTANISVSANTHYKAVMVFDGTQMRCGLKQVGSDYTYTAYKTATALTSNTSIYIGANWGATEPFLGSIDLNGIKSTVDGNLVYQPCLKIPYTESKTGSKIVSSSYRDRVNDMAEQFGYANYYTLDEDNGNFTLPQVELYGLIGDKTLRDSYYNGATYWELFSNRRLEQGGSCESGVEYTLPKPFADSNYVLTIPYSSKTATSFIPSATGDFIAKGMGLL